MIVQGFPLEQTAQYIRYGILIRMEFGDIPAYIFVMVVSQKGQFGFVSPHNRAIWPDLVQTFDGIFKKIRQFCIALTKALFQDLPPRYLDFQGSSFVMQCGKNIGRLFPIRQGRRRRIA
jgi:hypothetical protein